MADKREIDGRRARGAATRTKAVAAALDLFASQGYSATSVAMIAKAAQVNSQSLYHAFGNKEGLLAAAMEQASHEFFAQLQPAADASSPEQALGILVQTFARSPTYLRLHLVLILERRDGDVGLLERASQVRKRGRLLVQEALAPALAHIETGRRERALDDLGRVLMMFLDGAFVERQVNSDDLQFERLFELIAAAMRGALREILAREGVPA